LCSWHDRNLLQVHALWQADRERDGFGDIFGFEPFDLGFGTFEPIAGTLEIDMVLQFGTDDTGLDRAHADAFRAQLGAQMYRQVRDERFVPLYTAKAGKIFLAAIEEMLTRSAGPALTFCVI
jgi:hypothetical protein